MELCEKFENQCSKIYKNTNTNQACQDEYIMFVNMLYNKPIIDITCSCGKKRDSKYISMIGNEQCDTIALILESPHISEYDQKGQSLGPAMGTTGRNISDYLFDKLKKHLKEGVYKIVLIEAISFQCSNGIHPIQKKKRDEVFKYVWKNGGKDDFIERLKNYNPKYIINACSGGIKNINDGKSLNSLVNEALKKNFSANIYYISHPSSFWFKNKELIEYKEKR